MTFPFFTLLAIATILMVQGVNYTEPKSLVLKLIPYKTKHSFANYGTFDLHTSLTPEINHTKLLVEFYIGSPPMPQYAIMDTGSSLLWIQCDTCGEFLYQSTKYFNPKESDTFFALSCRSLWCKNLPHNECSIDGDCQYNATYVSGPASIGFGGWERFLFSSSEIGMGQIARNILFGCRIRNCSNDETPISFDDPKISGVFGIGPKSSSFVEQMGYQQFSYCIGKLSEPYDDNYWMIFGDANLLGQWTTMKVYSGQYIIKLIYIFIDEESIVIPVKGRGDAILDTGSPFTYLVNETYDEFLNGTKKVLSKLGFKEAEISSSAEVCYNGIIERDLINFPIISIGFQDSALLELKATNIFYQRGRRSFCLAIYRSSFVKNLGEQSIIGLIAQQNRNWGYDLVNNKVFFDDEIECRQAK